jgi:hypothetical protein
MHSSRGASEEHNVSFLRHAPHLVKEGPAKSTPVTAKGLVGLRRSAGNGA